MAGMETSKDTNWWVFTLPALLPITADPLLIVLSLGIAILAASLIAWAASSGGPAWPHQRSRIGKTTIPGIRGLPVLGSLLSLGGLPHRTLAAFSRLHKNSSAATKLMSFSLGATPAVVSSDPATARELLSHPLLSDRPVKLSARELFFSRAIGFAPSGTYWRFLRRLASSHLFSPRRLAFHSAARASDASTLLRAVAAEQALKGAVSLRRHLQFAALNNITGTTFGVRYEDSSNPDARELQEMVREGFDLLGSFNISDNLPWLSFLDPKRISKRCKALVPRVRQFVTRVIDEHRLSANAKGDAGDFVDVLLSLQDTEKLELDDMIAVLWEMVFRGTDTTALLTEWAMAELVLNPQVQARLRREIDEKVGANRAATDSDVAQMPYLQAVIKETLRAHPPGPLLSWARLATGDVQLSNGMVVPEGTTTMVNMWAITHDEAVWDRPEEFLPERFLAAEGGEDVDVRGNDLRLAPFGSGRRVCPGRSLGLVTVGLWVARLVQCFEWAPAGEAPVSLDEVLKLSLEMKNPLVAVALPRENINACF